MISAPLPDNEAFRQQTLDQYLVLDTTNEVAFDDLTRLAAIICDTPIALVSLIDRNRQWFKSKLGLDANETSREVAFCAHAILNDKIFEIPDARRDQRFADNPLVTDGPRIQFYAGTPLTAPNGAALGTLCVIDRKPRQLSGKQREALQILGRQVLAQLELRRKNFELAEQLQAQRDLEDKYVKYVAELEQYNARLQQVAGEDNLTRLMSRLAFYDKLIEEFSRAKRYENHLSLIMIDIDHFKQINEQIGNTIGDVYLGMLAMLLRENARSSDSLARWGGEEFVAILPNTSENGARMLAERFRLAVQQHDWPNVPITISIGIATRNEQLNNHEKLLQAADRALYHSKNNGRNQINHYQDLHKDASI